MALIDIPQYRSELAEIRKSLLAAAMPSTLTISANSWMS